MAKAVSGNTSRREVLSRQHAASRHDTDKGVERRFLRILSEALEHAVLCTTPTRTTRLSRDCARAPEFETSSVIPQRRIKTSSSLLKLALGGGLYPVRRASGQKRLLDLASDGDVGQQHELLDEAVGFTQFLLLYVNWIG